MRVLAARLGRFLESAELHLTILAQWEATSSWCVEASERSAATPIHVGKIQERLNDQGSIGPKATMCASRNG